MGARAAAEGLKIASLGAISAARDLGRSLEDCKARFDNSPTYGRKISIDIDISGRPVVKDVDREVRSGCSPVITPLESANAVVRKMLRDLARR